VFQKAEEAPDVTVFDPGSLGALTPAYASPEMLENREPDPRDDIYALGCITYELLTGRHPFNRLSATQARDAGLRPQRPPGLGYKQWRALRCALAFQREQRTVSVNQFLLEIGARDAWRQPRVLIGAGVAAVTVGVLVFVALRLPHLRSTGEPAVPPSESAAVGTASGPVRGEALPAPAAPPAPAPAPMPAPMPSLPAVSAALADVPCSALVPTIKGHAVRVQGYLGRGFGQARLKHTLAALPGVAEVDLALQEVAEDKCALLRVLGRYWVAHRMAPGAAADGTSIRLSPGSGRGGSKASELTEGDTLMVDVTTPAYQSYMAVDYFVLDGNVVHLLPNSTERETLAPPRYTATVGNMGNWGIGAPFGTEMLVLLATPVPLFDSVRPDSEAGPAYLRALDEQLARIAKSHGAGAVAVEFMQITTHAKR
jgi:hypothetical protein